MSIGKRAASCGIRVDQDKVYLMVDGESKGDGTVGGILDAFREFAVRYLKMQTTEEVQSNAAKIAEAERRNGVLAEIQKQCLQLEDAR